MQMRMTLEQVMERATSAPARILDLGANLGTLREGATADISVFELAVGDNEFVDSGGKRRGRRQRLVP